jgi:hypothetical protein
MGAKGMHRRVLSSGSRTESIKIYLDEDEEKEKEVMIVAEKTKSTEVQTDMMDRKEMTADDRAEEALRQLGKITTDTGASPLASPFFRSALDTNNTPTPTSKPPTCEPLTLTLAPLTFKKKPQPIHTHPLFPNVPYAPHPSAPGTKWYDVYKTAQSRRPIWEGPWTRRGHHDQVLAELFEAGNFTQAKVARKVWRRGVRREGGVETPLEVMRCREKKARERKARVGKEVGEYLERVREIS